ncbi:MAG: nucleotide exchange factor GrpE [Candidatus Eisenbacteria bacterium]|nr:nucleotide exchange factor GrpE [Candidatus Eisenbacteria bacterium]
MKPHVKTPGSDDALPRGERDKSPSDEPAELPVAEPVRESAESARMTGESSPEAIPDEAATPDAAERDSDFKDRWLRAEAELQNYRRRAQRDAEESRRDAEERVMLEMISAVDDLDRALDLARESGAPESWIQGVRLVANRIGEYLARRGVTAIDPVGEPFDPQVHEALLEVEPPSGVAPGSVVQVALKGYRRGPRALRAARVVVARRDSAGEA